MKKSLFVAAVAALALVACKKSEAVENAEAAVDSVATEAQATVDSVKVEAGAVVDSAKAAVEAAK